MTQFTDPTRPPKHVTLDQKTIALVEEFARHHQLNFSRAIEQLALIGLQDTKSIGLAQLNAHLVDHVTKERLAQLQSLLVHNTAQTLELDDMVSTIFKLQLVTLLQTTSVEQARALLILDPQRPADRFVLDTFDARRTRATRRAARRLQGLKQAAASLVAALWPIEPSAER